MLLNLISLGFTVLIAIIVMDLIPLQENMRCTDYANTTACPEAFWSQNYFESRDKFRSLSQRAGGKLVTVPVYGDALTMDAAVFEGNKDKVLVHLAGTGGVDGYLGSAIQTKIFSEWNGSSSSSGSTDGSDDSASSSSKEARPTVVFVHSVNPYGQSNFRHSNEANVNLHLNHLTKEEWVEVLGAAGGSSHSSDDDNDHEVIGGGIMSDKSSSGGDHATSTTSWNSFDSLKPALTFSTPPSIVDRYFFYFAGLYRLALSGGISAARRTLFQGQHHDASAPYFGGRGPQKSLVVLEELLEPYVSKAKIVIAIDVRSGAGQKSGIDTFVTRRGDSFAYENALAIWPDRLTKQPTGTNNATTTSSSAAAAATATTATEDVGTGDVTVGKFFPQTRLIDVKEEFGTVHWANVVRALVIENAAYQHARGSHLHEVTQQWLRDAFYPQRVTFKLMVLKLGLDAFVRGFDFLESWETSE